MVCGGQAGFSPSAWRAEMWRPCLSIRGLCCFVLLRLGRGAPSHSLKRPPLSSVRQVLLWADTLSVNCAFFFIFLLSLLSSQTLLHPFCPLYLFFSVNVPFVLLLLHCCPLLSSSPLLLHPPFLLSLVIAVLWWPTEAIRTDGRG